MARQNIIPQMFDIRPVDQSGNLNWSKINGLKSRNIISEETQKPAVIPRMSVEPKRRKIVYSKPKLFILGQKFDSDSVPLFEQHQEAPKEKETFVFHQQLPKLNISPQKIAIKEEKKKVAASTGQLFRKFIRVSKVFYTYPINLFVGFTKVVGQGFREIGKGMGTMAGLLIAIPIKIGYSLKNVFQFIFPSQRQLAFNPIKNLRYFGALVVVIALLIGSTALWSQGKILKGNVLGVSQAGYDNVNLAISSLKQQDFKSSAANFGEAYDKFSEASDEMGKMGSLLINISRFIPFASQLSSGSNAVESGKYLSLAGEELAKTTEIIASFEKIDTPQNTSLLDIFQKTESHLKIAQENLKKAQEKIEKINVTDIPEDKRNQFVKLKATLPTVISTTEAFLENENIFNDVLGGNGPRKFLFLFQNNQEMRATGGFIGSYGLLDINNGRVRQFFIDGIFNPDGQLQEKITPPIPIQKISAAWSLHDSNWFPDFPTSAKEAIVFYEKTGGPTADGVITLTPTVMKKLLEITGPIEMPEYKITLDAQNFTEKIQSEVEMNYDPKDNNPKKILSDLAPLVLDKLLSAKDLKIAIQTADALVGALNQKQVLIYSRNKSLQEIISQQGWSGEVIQTPKDYVSVINSNINGFKTDGVIDESIEHEAQIQADGSIVDTVTITRHHNGGNTGYEWWDKVNADYLRLYVPLGSKLLSVEGQTREVVKSPLDYQALGFENNPLVQKEESGTSIDEQSGTRIYAESGKTVFANWTYVSPQETVVLRYQYLLPFKVSLGSLEKTADSYSLLAQKQSGSIGSQFKSTVVFPSGYDVAWKYPENLQLEENKLQYQTDLATDKFLGIAFSTDSIIINQ